MRVPWLPLAASGHCAAHMKHRISGGGAAVGSASAAVGGFEKHDGQMWCVEPVVAFVTLSV